MALVTFKHIVLSINNSLREFLTKCKKETDARMLIKINNKEVRIRTKYNDNIVNYIHKLNLPH